MIGLIILVVAGVWIVYKTGLFDSANHNKEPLHSTQAQQLYRLQGKINNTADRIEQASSETEKIELAEKVISMLPVVKRLQKHHSGVRVKNLSLLERQMNDIISGNNETRGSLDEVIKGCKIHVTPDIRTRLSVLKLRDKQFRTEREAKDHVFEAYEGVVVPVLRSWEELGIDLQEARPGTTWTDIGQMYPEELDKYYSFLEQFRRVIEDESLSPPERVTLVQNLPDPDNFLTRLKQKYGENFPENVFIGRISKVDGISDSIGKILYDKQIYDENDLKNLNFEELIKINGVGQKRADQIIKATTSTPAVIDKTPEPKSKRNTVYDDRDIQNAANQVLETTQIMATSKNIDTIAGRAEFLSKRIQHLIWNCNDSRYSMDIQIAIDHYKTTFYNTQIHDWQLKAILEPQNFDHHHFSARCLFNGFKQYCEHQFNQIKNLKRENAIQNRFAKLKESFDEFLNEFDKDWYSTEANKFKMECFPEIKRISDMINSKQEQAS